VRRCTQCHGRCAARQTTKSAVVKRRAAHSRYREPGEGGQYTFDLGPLLLVEARPACPRSEKTVESTRSSPVHQTSHRSRSNASMLSASKAAGDVWIGHVWLLANSDPANFGCGRALQQDHSAVIFVYFKFVFLHWASNLVGSRKKAAQAAITDRRVAKTLHLLSEKPCNRGGGPSGQVSSVRHRGTLSCKEGPYREKIRACSSSAGNHDSSKRVPKTRDKRDGSGATTREGLR